MDWPTDDGADSYKLIRNNSVIATGLTTTSYTDTPNATQGGTYRVQACNRAGCSPSSDPVVTSAAAITSVTSVLLSNSSVGLLRSQSYQLSAGVMPINATDKTVRWSSSNPAVATVDSMLGVVTAVAPGTALITAASANGNLQATATVTVSSNAVRASGIQITTNPLSLAQGVTQLLSIGLTPSNATNQNVTWSSDNPSVATVSSLGVVNAVASGTANVVVTTQDGGFSASLPVTVTAPPTYTVGGTLSNLNQSGLNLTLSSNALSNTESIAVAAGSTSCRFNSQLPVGSSYSVTVRYQPVYQTCSVSQSGTTVLGNVTNVRVACSSQTYSVSGTITGLTAPNLILQYARDRYVYIRGLLNKDRDWAAKATAITKPTEKAMAASKEAEKAKATRDRLVDCQGLMFANRIKKTVIVFAYGSASLHDLTCDGLPGTQKGMLAGTQYAEAFAAIDRGDFAPLSV